MQNLQLNCNVYLKNFESLDVAKRKHLIKGLNFAERFALCELIRHGSEAQVNNEYKISLLHLIKNAKNLTPVITQKDQRTSWLAMIVKLILQQISNIAYLMHILTARKTHELISQYLQEKRCKSDISYPRITESKLQELLEVARQNSSMDAINLKELLEANGYSKQITHIQFTNDISFKNVCLDGVEFLNCEFTDCHFSNAIIRNASFQFCKFNLVSFMETRMDQVVFSDCELRATMFTCADLEGVSFLKSSVIGSGFEDARLKKCLFSNVSMPATHFLEANVSNSQIFESDLLQTVFFGNLKDFEIDLPSKESAKLTKATTAILVHPEVRGITTPKAYMKIDQSAGNIPLRISFNVPRVKSNCVRQEVEKALSIVCKDGQNSSSIAQRLITELSSYPEQYPNSSLILNKASKLASIVDSFFLPGGEDVPPALYGQECDQRTQWGEDYRRSILELGIVHQCYHKGVPLMAVCRGFQIAHVYFGAQLIQHVEGHDGVQLLEPMPGKSKGLIGSIMGGPVYSASSHHQGVSYENYPQQSLEPTVVYDNLVKGAELKFAGGVPMFLLQFHPEFYNAPTADSIIGEVVDAYTSLTMSNRNERFWKSLHASAEYHRKRQDLIEELKAKVNKK